MPPKQQKASIARGKSGEDSKEEPLQAVIIADTFETKFGPFTLEQPRCLLPLANVPVIEYTLEYLAAAGVQQAYVYAGAYVDQVDAYISASKWSDTTSSVQVDFLRCQATSVGDVMRDLDQKAYMAGDFIIVSGDVVVDFPIERALKAHKLRREKDKNAIMTMLLRETTESNHRYPNQIVPTFVIDPTKDRCLHYEENLASATFGAHIDPEILKTPEFDIRQDLIDCRLDICTPDVLSLWSDNFDNQQPRKDFLYGVLKDYELNGKTIHTYIIEDAYAHRIDNPAAYCAVANDLQKRVSTALALDNNISDSSYKRGRDGVLREQDVILQRPTQLGHDTIAGAGTSVGPGSKIIKSVLGRRCQIGKNAVIKSAYIWDDTTIGSNVRISQAIIANEAFIGDNCVIGEGALISFGVRIAPGTNVPPGARITKQDQDQATKKDTLSVSGLGGQGHTYQGRGDDEDYLPVSSTSFYQQSAFNDSASSLGSDEEMSEPSSKAGSRSQSFATNISDEEHGDRFQHDTVVTLLQRMQEGRQAGDMLSELMGLRFGGGADEKQVRQAVATALMRHIHSLVTAGTHTPEKASRSTLEQYHTLIRRKNAEQTTAEQVEFLLEVQTDLSGRSDGSRVMPFVMKDLYDLEVLEEESFTAWYADPKSYEAQVRATRAAAAPFITWLETAESEEESDEGEEEEEEEEEE